MQQSRKKRIRRRLLLILAGLFITAAALLITQPMWLWWLLERAFPGVVWRVETEDPVVALTFDDGPDAVYTPQVLEILTRHNARATFFLIGEHARQHPELLERIRAAGHAIGNHMDANGATVLMSTRAFEASLLRCERALELSSGQKFLRPGVGMIRPAQLELARRHGYTVVIGSAYAWDAQRPPAAYIRWAIGKNLRPGAIAILHDAGGNRSNTLAALEGILQEGKRRGFQWVTLPELFSRARDNTQH
jgi:peptidoglycan/xylan/chitin deacetylase (PgdA/CDA1 family)